MSLKRAMFKYNRARAITANRVGDILTACQELDYIALARDLDEQLRRMQSQPSATSMKHELVDEIPPIDFLGRVWGKVEAAKRPVTPLPELHWQNKRPVVAGKTVQEALCMPKTRRSKQPLFVKRKKRFEGPDVHKQPRVFRLVRQTYRQRYRKFTSDEDEHTAAIKLLANQNAGYCCYREHQNSDL